MRGDRRKNTGLELIFLNDLRAGVGRLMSSLPPQSGIMFTARVTHMESTSDQAGTGAGEDEDEPALTISPEKVCFIIIKAREFDAKDEVTEPDPGSNPSDDKGPDGARGP